MLVGVVRSVMVVGVMGSMVVGGVVGSVVVGDVVVVGIIIRIRSSSKYFFSHIDCLSVYCFRYSHLNYSSILHYSKYCYRVRTIH